MPERDTSRDSWDANADQWQEILNAHPIPRRSTQVDGREYLITARVVWERDGEEWIDTRTSVWTDRLRHDDRLVLVELIDPRWQGRGVWLAPGDVERR